MDIKMSCDVSPTPVYLGILVKFDYRKDENRDLVGSRNYYFISGFVD